MNHEKIIIHPSFSELNEWHEYSTNDIALVKLTDADAFSSKIPKPCLPQQNHDLPFNSVCYITGFGALNANDNGVIKFIRDGRVETKKDEICIKTLGLSYYDTKTMICVGRAKESTANSCRGDSGAPLICKNIYGSTAKGEEKFYLYGITSFGAFNCKTYTSSVYTRVSTYVDWIKSTMDSN